MPLMHKIKRLYEKKRGRSERDRKKRFKLDWKGRGEEGFYSSIILPIDDLNTDLI